MSAEFKNIISPIRNIVSKIGYPPEAGGISQDEAVTALTNLMAEARIEGGIEMLEDFEAELCPTDVDLATEWIGREEQRLKDFRASLRSKEEKNSGV